MGKHSKAVLRPRNKKGKASSESQTSRSQPVLRSRSEVGEREEPEDEAEESEDGEEDGEPKKKGKRRRRVKRTRGESEEGKPKKVRRVRRRKSQREREEVKDDEEASEEDDEEADPAKERSSSRKRPEVDADTVDLLRKLIKGVYEKCAPEKLSKLPSIFSKYDGLEAEVYRKACRKYGVTPEIDLSRFEADDAEESAKAAPTSTAKNGSERRRQREPASGPKPGSGGSWPFLEDYEGNSSCSSDEAIVKQQPRPPGSWQPKAAWPPWNPQNQFVTPGSWVPPTGSPGAWVPPVDAKAKPKPPPEAEKLDPDLKDLLYGRPVAGPPPPGPPPTGASPFEPMRHVSGPPGALQSGRQELRLEDFLGEWRDSMGNKVDVEWARNTSRGQLEVLLSKKGRDIIRLNVKQLGPGRFACGHYQLEVEKSSPFKIVWEDRTKNKLSIWER